MIKTITQKPIQVQTIQYLGDETELMELFSEAHRIPSGDMTIPTASGVIRIKIGDYIVKQIDGSIHTYSPDSINQIFDGI